nr:RodZ domain-containing protein [Pseudoroseomonas coralli]
MKRTARSDLQLAEAVRVGDELRQARLALGISLEEMAEQLRISRRYLDALEDGRVNDLPGLAYGTGFVRSYAQAMRLDAADLVRRFRQAAGGQSRGRDLVFPEPVPERGVPAGAIIMLGAVLAVGAYAAWYRWSGPSERTVDAVPALPPRMEEAAREAGQPPLPEPPAPATGASRSGSPPALLPPPATGGEAAPGTGVRAGSGSPGQAPPPPLAEARASAAAAESGRTQGAGPQAPATPPVASPSSQPPAPTGNAIVLRATQECWVQVREARSGRVLVSRVLQPGEAYEVPQEPGLLLTTGRAEGLAIEVGGVASQALATQVGVRRDILLDPAQLREARPGQLPTR